MKTIQVYDRPLCCSTGICGPQVDRVLPQFAADLDWLKSQRHQVERYNLAQQPAMFVQNRAVHQLLTEHGTGCLPVVMVDGKVVSQRDYPTREMLAQWTESHLAPQLPIASGSGCCGGSVCC